jgi:putative cardiolipin synthase
MRTFLVRWIGGGLLLLVLLVGSGLLLADHLTPQAIGTPSRALPIEAAATALDREVQPLVDAHAGKTGVIVLSDGLDAFAARALVSRKAGRSLDLMYYIWHDDFTGRLLGREVYNAAERGVRVRLLLDDMNAKGLDPQLLALDAHPNVELRLYNPFRNREGPWRLVEMVQRIFSLNHRMHNKAWIADGRVAVVGGRNIGVQYFDAHENVNFRDLDLLLVGPGVHEASAIFDAYWNSASVAPIAMLSRQDPQALQALLSDAAIDARGASAAPYLRRVANANGVRAYYQRKLRVHWSDGLHVVSDPPIKRERDGSGLIDQIAATLSTARKKALIVSPYFVPGEAGTEHLSAIAARGAQVGVVTNSLAANDVPVVHSGYARYREPLLEAGIDLYELRASNGQAHARGALGSSGASLHTKAFVVDDRRGFVGSFNLDQRSAYLNTEMGVLFDDPAIAADVRAEYLRLIEPANSYWTYLNADDNVRWLDGTATPPVIVTTEPEASAGRRATARVLGWLPIESQL